MRVCRENTEVMVRNLRSAGENSRADYLELMQQTIDSLIAGGDLPDSISDYARVLAKTNLALQALRGLIDAIQPFVSTNMRRWVDCHDFPDDNLVVLEVKGRDGFSKHVKLEELRRLWESFNIAVNARDW